MTVRQQKKKKKTPHPKNPLNLAQMLILGGLAVALCTICLMLGAVVYLRPFSAGQPPQTVAQTSPPPSLPAPTHTPSPTSMLPAAPNPTAIPSPTATYAVAPEFVNKDKIAEIIKFTEKWRQLSIPEKIPITYLTRQQVIEQWQQDSVDKTTLETVRQMQEFYKVMGLIAPEVDLVEAALRTESDAILGYYAPEEKMMYIIADSVNMFAQEEATFAHEYTHALQDYHFGLPTLLDPSTTNGDRLLAYRALPEGDARLMEQLYIDQNVPQDQRDYTAYRYLFQEHPQIEGVSPALGIFTYFPYTAGQYFVTYLFVSGSYSWQPVNEAYRNPPISSEQVMHPEKYLAGEMPTPITLPALALGGTWHELNQGVLGEIGCLVWLIDQVEPEVAVKAAAGWNGDAYSLWVNDSQQRVLVARSVWESEDEAAEFFEGFTTYMNLREETTSHPPEASNVLFWEYPAGQTLLSRRQNQVLILIVPDQATLDIVRGQFGGF
jgi:hypothetical protein